MFLDTLIYILKLFIPCIFNIFAFVANEMHIQYIWQYIHSSLQHVSTLLADDDTVMPKHVGVKSEYTVIYTGRALSWQRRRKQ